MTKPYVEWIDGEILRHQTEIARLTVARGVIEEASGALKKGPFVQRLLANPSKRKGSFVKARTRDLCIAALETLGHPATSRQIVAAVLAEHPEATQKALWNGLYNGHRKGAILREGKLYSLPLPQPEEVAA